MSEEYIYGINSITSLLENKPELVLEVLIADLNPKDKRKKFLVSLANRQGVSVNKILKNKIEKMFADANHQGVIARVKLPAMLSEDRFLQNLEISESSLFLILDGIQDPHNFGALLRTANAAGVDAVIITKDKSVKMTATVRKVASGAAEATPVVQVGNLARFLKKIQDLGVWVVGTAMEESQSIYDLGFNQATALVMGAEGKGIRDLTKKSCDYLAHIPMQGSVESLNVSVATGVCLFEINRKRIS